MTLREAQTPDLLEYFLAVGEGEHIVWLTSRRQICTSTSADKSTTEPMDILYPSDGETRCNATALRQAARHVARFYDSCMAETGLRGAQYTMLLYLSRHGPITVNEMADVMVMDRTTVAHSMKPLERDGLVAVTANPLDRRQRLITLTASGSRRVETGHAAWQRAQGIFERKFGPRKAQAMRRTMAEVVNVEFPA